MDRSPFDQLYEPLSRKGHVTVAVGGQVYACSGHGSGRYYSPSLIDVFDSETRLWHQQPTTGEMPPAVSRCACATIGSKIYVFGGYDGSSDHNFLHELDLSTMVWREVRPRNPSDGPQRKSDGGMVAYGDHSLILFGGLSSGGNETDELHVFNLKEGIWSSPHVSGTPPPPCFGFSLTKTDEHHAVMFGGCVGGHDNVSDVYLLDILNWHWTKVTTSGPSSPDPRQSHAACCIVGPLLGSLSPQLFVTGGLGSDWSVRTDAWVLDLQSSTWMKVNVPDGVSRRRYHTLTVVSSGPTSVHLVEFGGKRKLGGDPIAATAVLQLEVDKDQSQAGGPLVWRMADVATTAEPQRWKQELELTQKLNFPHHHRDPTYPGIKFYGESHCERVTSEGQRVAMEDVGVTVSVPSGAVAAGEEVDLTVRPCLTGRFILPEGYKAASPVYLVRASADFLQDVQVTIEHYSDLQSKEDCTNMTFLFASTTPVPGSTGPEYSFEEVPAERTTFKERQRVGTVAQCHSALIVVARRSEKGDTLYSLRLYRNASPTMDESTALFCITLCQQLYIKDLLEDLRRQFPDILQLPSVIEPIRLSGDLVSLDVPSDVSGWTIVPDRHPPQFTRSQVDFPLTNPTYAQYSGTYPPKILLSIFPSSDQQLGQSSARSCSLKVEGIVEDLLTPHLFTLYFPRVISPTEAPATLHTPVSISSSEVEGGRVDKVLNECDLSIVLDVVKGAAPKWKNVGVYLGFLGSEVDIIAASPSLFHEAPLGYLRDLLSQWLRWSPPTHPFPTIGNLASALRRAGEERMAFYLLPYYSERKAEMDLVRVQSELHNRESSMQDLQRALQECEEAQHAEAEILKREKDTTVITIRGEVECLQRQLQENKDTTHKLDSEVKALRAE